MAYDPMGWQKRLLDTFWRVFVLGVLGTVIGGVAGVTLLSSYSTRTDALLLGVVGGGSVGLMLGCGWHFWRGDKHGEMPPITTCGVIVWSFLVVPLMTALLWFEVEDTRDRIRQLQEISSDQLREIRVCDDYDLDDVLMVVDERESIEEFVDCCDDLRMYSPNHPSVDESWQVVLVGEPSIHLYCYSLVGVPDEVYGDFLDQTVQGSFSSRRLRGWFEGHVAHGG